MTRSSVFRIAFVLGLSMGSLINGVWWPALVCLAAALGFFLFVLSRIPGGRIG
jgi:hypothetical protein